jgi:nucleotide-binding universal stress UspA family protein
MSGLRRVIVGASGSPGNLCALRYAEHLARATGATLIPVHAWIPPGGDLADRRCPSLYLRRVWTEDARQRLAESLQAAWGQLPADLTIDPVVARGEPGPVLTAIACQPGDILVIGTGRRGTLAHLFSGWVSRYCLAHAHVPLMAIPPPTLAIHLGHSPLRWMFWHRPLTPDRVTHDRGKTAALTRPEDNRSFQRPDGLQISSALPPATELVFAASPQARSQPRETACLFKQDFCGHVDGSNGRVPGCRPGHQRLPPMAWISCPPALGMDRLAGCRSASHAVCLRWLPIWLSKFG